MNSFVAWQEPHDVADILVHDHRQLHVLLDQLKTAVGTRNVEAARTTFLEVQILEARHFAAEEAAMRRLGYPHYDEHKEHHDSLRNSLEAIGRFLLLEQPRQLNESVVDYLVQTVSHLEELDRPLQEFLQRQPA